MALKEQGATSDWERLKSIVDNIDGQPKLHVQHQLPLRAEPLQICMMRHITPPFRASGLDELFALAIRVGNVLACREMISRATTETAQTHIPFVLECAQAACHTTTLLESPRSPPELTTVNKVWRACGARSCGDGPFWSEVSSLQDPDVWHLFPAAFAAIFMTGVWNDIRYNSEIDGFENNEHVIIHAFGKGTQASACTK